MELMEKGHTPRRRGDSQRVAVAEDQRSRAWTVCEMREEREEELNHGGFGLWKCSGSQWRDVTCQGWKEREMVFEAEL